MWSVRLPYSSPAVVRDTSQVWCNAYAPYGRFTLAEDVLDWCAENDIKPCSAHLIQEGASSDWYFNIWFDVELSAVAFRMRW